jgi:hypothetical protein
LILSLAAMRRIPDFRQALRLSMTPSEFTADETPQLVTDHISAVATRSGRCPRRKAAGRNNVAAEIGGLPDLTAVFVVFTGVFGAAIGELLLGVLPLRSALARGALLGAGAHGAGVAKAHELGQGEGSVAGLMLVLIGVTNVLLAPLLAHVL